MANAHSPDKISTNAAASLPHGRRRRWPRIVLWSAGCLAAIALLGAGAGMLWLRSAALAALPQLDGSVHVAGLSAPVTVRRDAHGVPHIDAATQDDLFTALGYVTAQDRLWQMDMLRRSADGELAEILGPSLVKHDETQRVLEIRRTAERIYGEQPAADRARLDDYARGVNLYIAHCEATGALPPEFKLLLYRPKTWSGVDSISVGLMMVETLDTRVRTKLARGQVTAKLHNPRLEADLYPVGSWRDHPPTGIDLDLSKPHPEPPGTEDSGEDENTETRIAPDNAQPGELLAEDGSGALLDMLGLPTCNGCTAGSNNWVVAGTHTASGKPLLSNDMHLGLTEP
ncbi:MAG TPA: penicillin acylase family protein, partial [Terracidiphilus sp.]|nr:penicillin acylase family protein [Terracidiphilus sp.]